MTPKIQSWPMYQKSFFKRCIYKIGSNKVRNWQFKFRTETKLKVEQWTKTWNFSNNTATSSNLAQKVSEMTIYVPNWNQNFKVTNVPKNSFVRKTLYWQKTEIQLHHSCFEKFVLKFVSELTQKFQSWPMYKMMKFQWYDSCLDKLSSTEFQNWQFWFRIDPKNSNLTNELKS